jgi:membrane-associated phospholipid phosphatase
MIAAPLPISVARPATDRVVYAAGALTVAYLAATVAPMAAYAVGSRHWLPLVAHLIALAGAAHVTASRRAALRPLREWLPLIVGPFLYVELRWLIAGLGRPHADALVQGWERTFFPGNPASTWAAAFPIRWVSEALHLAYASYYLIVYVPPAILFSRGRRAAHAETLLALALVYGACFTAFLVFPVDGPRFLVGPAPAPDGPIRTFVLRLLETGSSRGTAFPSSHVAASVVASLAALRHQRAVGVVVSALTLALIAATVYGGFHYGVDALAGLAVGLAAWPLAAALCRTLSRPGEQSASAA